MARAGVLLVLLANAALAQDATVDLMTREGVALVAGEWRYSDTRVVEIDGTGPRGEPVRTHDFTPHAGGIDFDDSRWEVLDPPSLGEPRSTGKICFNWYRIHVTIPEAIGDFSTRGTTVVFEVLVDDYAEVWVNGQLPRDFGQSGGSVIKGFNAPNRLVIAQNAQPGQRIQLAVFGINGPISDAPGNFIFFRSAKLGFHLPVRARAVRSSHR
jgi:gluconolactonase